MRLHRKHHYAWVVAVACAACFGGVVGIMLNSRGVFLLPICEDLGFKLSALTLANTFYGIAALCMMPVAVKILPKTNIRAAMSAAAILMAGLHLLTTTFHSVYLFYAASILQGGCVPFLVGMPVPLLITHWFAKKKGVCWAWSAQARVSSV